MRLQRAAGLAILACVAARGSFVYGAIEYDQNVTPDVIFGSGNANGSFTTDRSNGIEVGLRAKQRFPPANIFNSNGDGTYSFPVGVGTGGTAPRPLWNFEWSVNTDYLDSTGFDLDDLTYEMRIDFDPSPAMNNSQIFDPIIGPYFDHAIGDNSTPNGGGQTAPSSDQVAYAALIAANNVAQNSWTMTFFDDASHVFDPDVNGIYTIELDAIGTTGVLASASIDVVVGQQLVVPEPASVFAWAGLAVCLGAVTWRKGRRP